MCRALNITSGKDWSSGFSPRLSGPAALHDPPHFLHLVARRPSSCGTVCIPVGRSRRLATFFPAHGSRGIERIGDVGVCQELQGPKGCHLRQAYGKYVGRAQGMATFVHALHCVPASSALDIWPQVEGSRTERGVCVAVQMFRSCS